MEILNEVDVTRKMLSTIRGNNSLNNQKLINENNNSTSDEEELSSSELSEEQKNFRDTVSPRVEFTSFKVYPKSKNVVFSGKFDSLGGLEWEFTLEDNNGLYISANNVPFSDDTIDLIKKLKGFYDNWADEWSQKLATEYNRGSKDDEDVSVSDSA